MTSRSIHSVKCVGSDQVPLKHVGDSGRPEVRLVQQTRTSGGREQRQYYREQLELDSIPPAPRAALDPLPRALTDVKVGEPMVLTLLVRMCHAGLSC